MNKDGFWIENQKGIKSLAREYFTKLFESQIVDHGRVINAVQTILSDTDNFNLTVSFKMIEFKQILLVCTRISH